MSVWAWRSAVRVRKKCNTHHGLSVNTCKTDHLVDQLPPKLHQGECEAIALAKELNAVLLVDEHEARREAHRLGIEYMGSLRVLKEAKARGIIPEIKPILDEIIVAGTYISDTLYQAFLSEVDEA